ncbi:hypothetical protein DFH07DRAFT_1011957 [Mycena maculata]|uniref:Uncharacterized protein n=1 Tax=Mycena maculata TaxID=230809 RepID=A0AAD7HE75_9AGAR|nr:hypothetical protein DFH07DRAFT_1011957 [Mycena maculata]
MACYRTASHVRATSRPQHRDTARAQPREQAQRLDACVFVGHFRFPVPPPTPAAILSGGYRPEEGECIEYVPRRPEFCGRPSLSIAFAVHRHPAPYLKEILRGRIVLDGAHDTVMADHGWSRTLWALEWPGYALASNRLAVAGLTRTTLAQEIAGTVALFLRDAARAPAPLGENSAWAARNVHFGDIRLVALNYYGRVWIPVLALDAV